MLYQTVNPHGGDRYSRPVRLDFSTNTNPLGAPEAVRRAVAESARLVERYPDPYCRDLTAALAEFEAVPPERILCGGGAAELIFSFCAAVRPKRMLELAPTFSEYAAAVTAAGGEVIRYPLRAENGFALTEEFLDATEQSDCDTVFLCSPNNPTGQLIDFALLERIAERCRRLGVRLFLDECFLDLAGGHSVKKLLPEHPELFILKAFTKNFAMAGLRLGYCLTWDRELLAAMARTVQPWNVSLPAQMAGVAALGEQGFLERSRALICGEREWLREKLTALGFFVCPSQANYLLLRHERPVAAALLERGILVRDCANYHGLDGHWLRIAVRPPEENRQLIAALERVLEEV